MGRVILKLECFHDDIAARQRALRAVDRATRNRVNSRHVVTEMRLTALGDARTWVAEVVGITAAGRIERKFVDGLKDYSDANGVGSRGVYKYYVLREGPLYEIVDRPGYGKPQRRRYCYVICGKIVSISIDEALRCLK